MGAEAGGSCSPTYLFYQGVLPSSALRSEIVAPMVLGYKKTLLSLFSIFLIWYLAAKDPRRKSWWLSFSESLAQVGRTFLRGWADQEDLGLPPFLYSLQPTWV